MRARVLRTTAALAAALALLAACDRSKGPTPPVPHPTTQQPATPASASTR